MDKTINTTNNQEVNAMTNAISNNVKISMPAQNALVLSNLSKLVPIEECAQAITVSCNKPLSLLDLVPEEEKAELMETIPLEMKKIRKLGIFDPTRNMAHINNALGNMFSARTYVDEKGLRYIEYVQRYSDGTFSPVMTIPQACIKIAVKYQFDFKEIKECGFRRVMENFVTEATINYAGRFRGPSEDEMDMQDILNTFCAVLELLPVVSDYKIQLTGEDFFYYLNNHIYELSYYHLFSNYKSYFPLTDSALSELAELMDMPKGHLLKKLKDEDLLYLTPSSRGYQTNVRIKSNNGKKETEWRYCIYKLAYFAEVDEHPPAVLGYDEF